MISSLPFHVLRRCKTEHLIQGHRYLDAPLTRARKVAFWDLSENPLSLLTWRQITAILLSLLLLQIVINSSSTTSLSACPVSMEQGVRAGATATSKARILISTGSYNNVIDGVSSTMNKLVEYLLDNGYEVLVLAPVLNGGGAVREHAGLLVPTPSYTLPFRSEYSAAFMDSCTQQVVEQFQPDLVHIATPDALGYGLQSWAASRSIPVVCSYHTRFPAYLEYYLFGLHAPVEAALWSWMRFFYGRCLHTYPPTQSTMEELHRFGLQGDIRIWPRGIDLTMFNPKHRSQSLRASWGADDNTVVVLLVSRLVKEKNVMLFSQTMAELRRLTLNYKIVVVGDGPAKASMEALIPEAHFLGTVVKNELAVVYASADVFFFPSKTETLGSVTLEAMASGIPVLVANTTGSADIVQHMDTGILIDVDSEDMWLQGILTMIVNTRLRKDLAQNAMNVLQRSEEMTWGKSMRLLTQHYSEVLS